VPAHALDAEIARRGNAVAVLAFSRPDERVECWIRMPREPQACAQRLYAALRELDAAGCGAILIDTPPGTAEWDAIRDRLSRATG
jgi:L-threonylcarbamoyladenylate synthase